MKIKLQTVVDAIEQTSEAYRLYYDLQTQNTVYLLDKYITGEADEELSALLESDPDRFLAFPMKYAINEYSIMRSFVDYLPPGRIKDKLSVYSRQRRISAF